MRPPKRIAAGITTVVVMVSVGAGLAQAAQKGSSPGAGASAIRGGHGPGGPGSAATAAYLGLTAAELRTQLESGKTLADVAKAQGKTASGLEDAIVADAKTHLDAGVTAGKLTAAQEAAMLADLKSHVDDMINGVGPAPGGTVVTATARPTRASSRATSASPQRSSARRWRPGRRWPTSQRHRARP